MRRRLEWDPERRGRCVCLAMLALGASLAIACEWPPGRPRLADRPVPAARTRDFATLYGRHCAGCHGADGTLGAARPLADSLYLAWAGDAHLRRAIAEGIPGTLMPGFARDAGGALGEDQIEVLVRGLRQRATTGTPSGLPPYEPASPGDPAHGQLVFAARCASCHGPDGAGGAVTDPAYLSIVSDRALRAAIVAGRIDLGMPDYRGGSDPAAAPLRVREIDDLLAWLAAQRPTPAGPIGRAGERTEEAPR